MLRNVCADVAGLVLQQEVADDGKRGLHNEGAVVSIKLMRDEESWHFDETNEVRIEFDIPDMPGSTAAASCHDGARLKAAAAEAALEGRRHAVRLARRRRFTIE